MDNGTAFTLLVTDIKGTIVAQSEAAPKATLTFDRAYQPGDRLVLLASRWPVAVRLSLDGHLPPALVYLTADRLEYPVPVGEPALAYPPEAFGAGRHTLTAEPADPGEWRAHRNLSLNPLDRRGETAYYPHCIANVETRDESVFAARNTIDGVTENNCHGEWPYQSWGDDENPHAEITIQFGRRVRVDKAVIHLRADFPHDNYWREVTLLFSDGSQLTTPLRKTAEEQTVSFEPRAVEWVKLTRLIKSEEESPFPALTQWAIYGTEA